MNGYLMETNQKPSWMHRKSEDSNRDRQSSHAGVQARQSTLQGVRARRPMRHTPPTKRNHPGKGHISEPIHLEVHRLYYIEALMKEGVGDDGLAVAWQLPGDPPPKNLSAPIPGTYLACEAPTAPRNFGNRSKKTRRGIQVQPNRVSLRCLHQGLARCACSSWVG